MKTKEVVLLKEQLEQERARLVQELAGLYETIKEEVDIDIGEGDPKWAERDLAISLIPVKERRLQAVEEALTEARRGRYGICERCGKPIDPERLEALPEATLCVQCKLIVERQQR